MRSRRVQFRTAVVLAAVALAAAVAPRALAKLNHPVATPQLATAAHRSFPVLVSATGTVVPASQVQLDFGTSGRIAEIDVTAGQSVHAGQLIAKLDDSEQRASLSEAQAVLAGAQAVLAGASQPVGTTELLALKHAVLNAQSALVAVRSSVDGVNQQDAARVAADQSQLAADESKQRADGCAGSSSSSASPTPNPSTCAADQTAISDDNRQLQESQARQQQDQQNGQSRVDQATLQLSDAQGNLAAATAPDTTRVAQAQANVDAARAQVSRAQSLVDRATLTAPVAGVIAAVNAQVGEAAGGSSGSVATAPGSTAPLPQASDNNGAPSVPATKAFVVLSTGPGFDVAAPFAEVDAARLGVGQRCTVTVDALPGLSLPCHVIGVASSATVISGVVDYYATVAPDGSDSRLKNGMTADVQVTVDSATDVVAVPSQALYSDNGQMLVDVWYEQHAVATPVKIGRVGTTLTEVLAGLGDGEQVVVGSHTALRTPAP